MIYLQLFFEFFKTGLFAIGGGLVTIPFLSKMGDTFGWFSHEELANMLAISESTPGPIGINMATYVGFKMGGILGSLCATIGEVAPAIIIVMIIAKTLNEFKDSKYVKAAFEGLRPVVFGLMTSAFLAIFTSSVIFLDKYKESGNINDLFDIRIIVLFMSVLLLNKKWKIHPVFYIALAAIISVILKI